MWLHDDRNQIFSVGTGSSISVGEFSTRCASLLGPGCLGRGRSQNNTERPHRAQTPLLLVLSVCSCCPLQGNAVLASLSGWKLRQWLIKWLSQCHNKSCRSDLPHSPENPVECCLQYTAPLIFCNCICSRGKSWSGSTNLSNTTSMENPMENLWAKNPVPINVWTGCTLFNVFPARSG